MGKTGGFHDVRIGPEVDREGAAYLGDLQRMGEPRANEIVGFWAENLGFGA